MRWKKYPLLIMLCYFCAFSCFCSAAFLPPLLKSYKHNSISIAESEVLKEDAKKEIVRTDAPPVKKKKPKPRIVISGSLQTNNL